MSAGPVVTPGRHRPAWPLHCAAARVLSPLQSLGPTGFCSVWALLSLSAPLGGVWVSDWLLHTLRRPLLFSGQESFCCCGCSLLFCGGHCPVPSVLVADMAPPGMPSAWGLKPRGPLGLPLRSSYSRNFFFHLSSYLTSFPFSFCSWNSCYFVLPLSLLLCVSQPFPLISPSLYFLYMFI